MPQYNAAEGKYKTKTKAGNYNAWFDLHSSKYDIVAQHDVDFIPSKDFFNATLGYFRDPEIAFVGTPQIYGNKNESWIARGAAEQAYGFYGHVQRGLHGHDMSLFIGANHLVRVAAHDDIEGYSGHIVEDHLTGMKFYAKKWKSVYVPEVLAVGEGPATWESYFSQQMRWAFGLIDILFKHSPTLFIRMKKRHAINYFLLQQYYFSGLAQAIGVFLMSLYFVFGFQSTSMELAPLFYLYLPLLLLQLCVFFWLQRYNILPEERGLLIRGRLLSLAAWPIYLSALLGVLVGRRLTYAITPKGGAQTTETHPLLFLPHFIIGSISFLGLLTAKLTGNLAPQILFWAIVNTLTMYGFCAAVLLQPNYIQSYKRALTKYFPYITVPATAAAIVLLVNGSYLNKKPALEVQDTTPVKAAVVAETSEIQYDTHIVEDGESLRYISKQYYGDESEWKKIIIDRQPDLIYAGDVVLMPKKASTGIPATGN